MAHLQSCRFMRPYRGTFPIWSSMGLCVTVTKMAMHRCWFLASSAQSFPRLFFQFGAYTDIPMTKCTKNALQMWLKFCAKAVRVAKNFYIAGDINVEFSLMCTDENEEEELTKLYGPLRWQGYDKDPGGFFLGEKKKVVRDHERI